LWKIALVTCPINEARAENAQLETVFPLIRAGQFLGVDLSTDFWVVTRPGERSYVALASTDDEEEERSFLPDVAVASSRGTRKGGRKAKGTRVGLAVHGEPAPVTMQALVKAEYRETFLEIRQDPNHKLITGIEVLSPSNNAPVPRVGGCTTGSGWRT